MEVKSQIKAIVCKIEKKVGDYINIDEDILILESLKICKYI